MFIVKLTTLRMKLKRFMNNNTYILNIEHVLQT